MINIENIREAIKNAELQMDAYSISTDASFRDVGMDSLDIFNVFLEIEKSFGIQIPDDKIDKLQTIEAIQNYLNSIK